MKTCPRCARSYPDSESFCEVDGTALVQGSSAGQAPQGTTPAGAPAEGTIECPVCGGKAQPGELVCNFCGARLVQDSSAEPEIVDDDAAEQTRRPAGGARRPSPETFIPLREKLTATGFTPPTADDDDESEEPRRPLFSIIGYTVAALVALAAGAWLALHLSAGPAKPPKLASATPVATAAPAIPTGPLVQLASSIPVQTLGESASAPERNIDAARKVFDSNTSGLLDDYRTALSGDSSLSDGMMVRLTVAPNGEVTAAAVRTSTALNPELDAAVVKSMMGWKFAPFNGGVVKADYPIIFANAAAQASTIDSSLAAKIAALSPAEADEYASAPVPVATPTPAMEAAAPAPPSALPAPPPVAKPHKPVRRRPEMAAIRPRRPPLLERVQSALRSNRKLGRVKAYTNGGVVTLYGRVFDNNDKLLAERTVRRVSGVTDVIDQLTTDEAQWAAAEARIAQSLANAGLGGVTVKVIGNDAYLNGEVPTKLDRERAVTIAEAAAPVKVRSNLIRVAPGRVFGF
jgi:BON domain